MKSDIPYPPGLIEEAADFKAVAVYEPSAGKIVHMHIVKVFEGGRAVSEQEAVETAHREAKRLGHDIAKLRTKVSTDSKHATLPHRIDIKTGDFVALPFEIGGLLTPGPR
ncbi:MAG: hypothetical protein L0211_12875 [Planctomycetaceae bacterium]|nr:hypothetical protein [Planctomycetaceae bacterium]